jgi:hypothetical protein
MKIEMCMSRRKERTVRRKLKIRTNCPKCGSNSLLSVAPDQFCCDCNWSTCFEYAEAGLMNNLEVAAWEHFGEKSIEQAPVTKSDTNENPSLPESA